MAFGDVTDSKLAIVPPSARWTALSNHKWSWTYRALIYCPFHTSTIASCLLEMWSADEMPFAKVGAWHCQVCDRSGEAAAIDLRADVDYRCALPRTVWLTPGLVRGIA